MVDNNHRKGLRSKKSEVLRVKSEERKHMNSSLFVLHSSLNL